SIQINPLHQASKAPMIANTVVNTSANTCMALARKTIDFSCLAICNKYQTNKVLMTAAIIANIEPMVTCSNSCPTINALMELKITINPVNEINAPSTPDEINWLLP